ncbi:MAG: hypothetical protein J0M24_26745 [Verrucomicrobia bacterium]|nr:hypothetical protein [Verrucomicrobiota bacterium]
MKNRNWVRWLVIVGFAVGGIAALVDGLRELQQEGTPFSWFVLALAVVVDVAALWAIAYFACFRQYSRMAALVAVFVALNVFVWILSVPVWLGLSERPGAGVGSGSQFLDILVTLGVAVAAWHGARWVFRRVRGWLQAWLPRLFSDAEGT